MILALHKVEADLIDKRQWPAEDLLEGHGDLLEHDKPVDDGKVATGRHRVQIVAIVCGLRREIAKIERLDRGVLLFGKPKIIRRQSVAEAAAPGVQLNVERVAADVGLEFDEVVATTQGAELRHATLRSSRTAPRRLPRIVDGEAVTLGSCPVDALAIVLGVVGGTAANA